MAKIPASPLEITEALAQDYKTTYGEDLISISLINSHNYIPKKTEINFLIVLSDTGIQHLSACFPLVEKWRKYNVALPLFMTRQYISSSLDSFPIEFFNLKKHYQLIYGEDVLASTEFSRENLRLECETQIKGKLLHLREEFLGTYANRKALEALVQRSLPVFATVFEALLNLKNVDPPGDRNAIIITTAQVYELDLGLFEQIVQIADKKVHLTSEELVKVLESYIMQIRKLALIIDEMK
jgi:hypothetical protein